jgi:hypothetical protein
MQMRVSGVSTPETADASLWRLHALAPSLFPAAEPKDSLSLLLLIFSTFFMPQMRVWEQALAHALNLWRLDTLAPSLFPAAEPKDSLLLLLLISGVSTLLLRACSRLQSSGKASC